MLGNKYLFWFGAIFAMVGGVLLATKYFVSGGICMGLGYIIAHYQDTKCKKVK